MIELPSAVAFLGGVLVLAAALGALIAGTRTGIHRSTIDDQAKAISALEKRAEASERAEAECIKRQDVLDEKLNVQRELNATLAATITGAAELSMVVNAQVEASRQATERHAEVVTLLTQLAGQR